MTICGRFGRKSTPCDLQTAENILPVAGLRIVRDGTVIFHDVNWHVQRGDIGFAATDFFDAGQRDKAAP